MGAWNVDAFSNDVGCDWALIFVENPDFNKVTALIEYVARSKGHKISAWCSHECLVACEIVARLKGNFSNLHTCSEEIDEWVASVDIVPTDELVALTVQAINRIMSADCELPGLWDDAETKTAWLAEMDDLLRRVVS